jgi:hypothetical protein
MAPGVWLGASRPFEVERVSSETAARELRIDAIQALSGVLLQALRETERRKESEAKLQFEQRRQLESGMAAAALTDLAGAKQGLGGFPNRRCCWRRARLPRTLDSKYPRL